MIDGWILKDLPVNLPLSMEGLNKNKRAMILGGNTFDSTCVGSSGDLDHPQDKETLDSHLETYFPGDVDTVLAPYRAYLDQAEMRNNDGLADVPEPDPWCNEFCTVWLTMSRDTGVMCPALWLARKLSSAPPGSHDETAVWLYRFGYNATAPGDTVDHGGEIDFVWQRNTAFTSRNSETVSTNIGDLWTSFVAKGVPEFAEHSKRWPREWAAFQADHTEVFLDFNGTNKTEGAGLGDAAGAFSGLFGDTCGAWEDYINQGDDKLTNFNNFGYLC